MGVDNTAGKVVDDDLGDVEVDIDATRVKERLKLVDNAISLNNDNVERGGDLILIELGDVSVKLSGLAETIKEAS